jgi:hypothetical protein
VRFTRRLELPAPIRDARALRTLALLDPSRIRRRRQSTR